MFITREYVKYYIGDPMYRAHIDAVHAHPRNHDMYTGAIVEAVLSAIDCSGIVALISRDEVDLNRYIDRDNEVCREAHTQYRHSIKEIVCATTKLKDEQLVKPHLHLAIHGMRDDSSQNEVILGTVLKRSCDEEILHKVYERFRSFVKKIGINETGYSGHPSLLVHRTGEEGYKGYGNNYNIIQIELSKKIRRAFFDDYKHNKKSDLALLISNIIEDFSSD